MRTEELQIGDWVQNPFGLVGRVQSIKYMPKDHGDEYGGYHLVTLAFGESDQTFNINDAQPIPLTPEILEKNGFHYTNQHTLKGADTYVLRLEQRGFDYTITIKLNDYFALDSYDDRMYRLAEIETGKWYVHQLQHALRLCGITKEIQI